MNANEKRIKQLQKKLQNHNDYVQGHGPNVVDEEWTADHCNMFTISETIEDYQVIRQYDIEIECVDPMERRNEEEDARYFEITQRYDRMYEEDKMRNNKLTTSEEYERERAMESELESLDEDIMERLMDETGDAWHTFESGEYMQTWLNMTTGEVVQFGKVYDPNPIYCDYSKKRWSILRPQRNAKHRKFIEKFDSNFGSGHYIDISVHPSLQAVGYEGIEAADWWYGCGDEQPEDAKFVAEMQEPWSQFLYGLVKGKGSKYDTQFKAYGSHAVFHVAGKDEEYRKKYLAAVKIARRNLYRISDYGVWDDMVDALIQLDRDTHNAHYVCPDNLTEAHDRWTALYNRKKAELEAKRKAEEARKHEEAYRERIAKYLNVMLHTKHCDMFVCPTVADMAEEGKHMHHCVFAMGYYKKPTSLIVLVRDKQGNRVSTMELNTNTWSIVQNRGVSNSCPEYDEEVRNSIKKNIRLFKQAGKKTKTKTKTITLSTETAALAA